MDYTEMEILESPIKRASEDTTLDKEVLSQYKIDFDTYFKTIACNETNRYDFLSKESGVSRRSLIQYNNRKTVPSPKSALKIYKVFKSYCTTLKEFKSSLPACIYEYTQSHPSFNELNFSNYASKEEFNSQILNCSTFREILIKGYQSNIESPLTKDFIAFKFGEFGLEILSEMISKKYLVQKGIQLLPGVHPELDEETVIFLSHWAIKEKVVLDHKDNQFEHFVHFYANGVSKSAYEDIIRVAQEAATKIEAISNTPGNEGPMSFYSSMAIDTGVRSKNTKAGLQ